MALIKTDLPLELFTDDLSPETEASLTLSVPQQNFGDFQVTIQFSTPWRTGVLDSHVEQSTMVILCRYHLA